MSLPRSKRSQTYRTRIEQVQKLAKEIADTIKGGEVFALIGELGSGKTTFTQHLGKALGVKNTITSPTFVIMQEYGTSIKNKKQPLYLYHLDLYRLSSSTVKIADDIASLGLEQIWNQPNTITVIEWADKIKSYLPQQTTYIYFAPNDNPQ